MPRMSAECVSFVFGCSVHSNPKDPNAGKKTPGKEKGQSSVYDEKVIPYPLIKTASILKKTASPDVKQKSGRVLTWKYPLQYYMDRSPRHYRNNK